MKATDHSEPSSGALKVLVIDDEPMQTEAVAETLERIGYQCDVANSGKAGARKIDQNDYDVILTDLRMSDMDGMAILRKAKQVLPEAEVVVITGHSDIKTAVEAIQMGAANYLTKPVGMHEIRTIVDKAVEKLKLSRQNKELRRQLDEKFGFEGILGDSLRMHEVLTKLKTIAPTSASVLILGETGTGKELVARALHNNSPRKNKPFAAMNCTAINENLLDDELFGHEPGSYTGASQRRVGRFEYANGGTLFLDEVGDMPLTLQAKLLRVLETQEVVRIGGNDPIKVDVRVLSATHKNLEEAVAKKEFREDLLYRLRVVTIRIPALRERKEDIPILATHFLKEFNKREHKTVARISEMVLRTMMAYDWKGNVRELRNLMQGLVITDQDGTIDMDDLQAVDSDGRLIKHLPNKTSGADDLIGRPLAEIERYYIEQTLQRTSGNREEASKLLGIGERTLYRVIRDWKVQDQIKEAIDGSGGDLALAAEKLSLTEAALQRKLKKLGLREGEEDEE